RRFTSPRRPSTSSRRSGESTPSESKLSRWWHTGSNSTGETMSDYRIRKTTNYALFVRSEENRDLDKKKHSRLKASMDEYGFIPSFPAVPRRRPDGRKDVCEGRVCQGGMTGAARATGSADPVDPGAARERPRGE